ncbi:MAG: hypothetical protein ACRDHO_12610 [Actinomycetota bacterium]
MKKAFRRAGWLARSGKGHTVFTDGVHTVPVDDDVKRFSPGLLAAMRRESGLARDEFIRLLRDA